MDHTFIIMNIDKIIKLLEREQSTETLSTDNGGLDVQIDRVLCGVTYIINS